VTARSLGVTDLWDAFDWNVTPEEFKKEQRERYKRWLERNRETAEAKKAAVPE